MANKQKHNSGIRWHKLILELIVLFLGVTAGFLLNNWRESHLELKIERKYLQGFSSDITKNITELQEKITADSLWLERSLPLLMMIKNTNLPADSATVVMRRIVETSRLDINKGTYEDIINSGKLNIIRDFDLKNSIVDYHIALGGITYIDDYTGQFFSDFVLPFLFREFNLLTGELTNPGIIKTTEFANLFAGYLSMVQERRRIYSGVLERSYSLLELLPSEKHDKK